MSKYIITPEVEFNHQYPDANDPRTRTITNKDAIKKLGTILGIWAHPDDETFSSGGIMAAAIQNGQAVVCVTATDGEASRARHKHSNDIAGIRTSELREALTYLGVQRYHLLGFADGKCDQVNQTQAASKIAAYIRRYKPDTILTFGPDGFTGHLDHRAVSRWVDQACKLTKSSAAIYHVVQSKAVYRLYLKLAHKVLNRIFRVSLLPLYNEDECDICFKLPSSTLRQKYKALRAMPSQTRQLMRYLPRSYVRAGLGTECFIHRERGYAGNIEP